MFHEFLDCVFCVLRGGIRGCGGIDCGDVFNIDLLEFGVSHISGAGIPLNGCFLRVFLFEFFEHCYGFLWGDGCCSEFLCFGDNAVGAFESDFAPHSCDRIDEETDFVLCQGDSEGRLICVYLKG